ncbi:hypothetical protein N7495_000416 [Penicillium taxi]|uniref:uncharacterized protein n=1 Tax=Penicillium taxi TaxID=168475 RepID=UPI002544FFF0|nr:uncharacterized protein N7495_000416 [Penicillium taxi]KAJ5907734.1 hypothetical protein N7495_000416 [Penicillium taxi]
MEYNQEEDPTPKTIAEIWEHVKEEFERCTEERLEPTTERSLKTLRRTIENNQFAQNTRGKKAKVAGLKILKFVQLLGGVASQGASLAFPPSELCFNALSLLLDTVQRVAGYDSVIEDIFLKIEPVLSQFKIYEKIERIEKIDEQLVLTIHRVMSCFVMLCAKCTNYNKSKSHRWHERGKAALFDDDTTAELQNLSDLISSQRDIQGAVTLGLAIENRHYLQQLSLLSETLRQYVEDIWEQIGDLIAAEQGRQLAQTEKYHLEKIKKALGVDDAQISNSIDLCENLWENSVQDSGHWLIQRKDFIDWRDGDAETSPLLVLNGDPGCGKSVMSSVIFHHLSDKQFQDGGGTLVTYHSFPIATGKTGEDVKPAITALKSLCRQLAAKDSAYAKCIADSFKAPAKNSKYIQEAKCRQLWDDLRLGVPTQTNIHFLLLDAVDNLPQNDFQELTKIFRKIAADKGGRTRIIVSGRLLQAKLLSTGTDELPGTWINVKEHNTINIEKYAKREIERAGLFQIWIDVKKRLVSRAEGSFIKAQHDIAMIKDKVASKATKEAIITALDEKRKSPKDVVKDDLRSLWISLQPDLVDELNELLLWVHFGPYYYDVEQLQAILHLRQRPIPVQPLSDRIEEEYSKIFEVKQDKDIILKHYIRGCVVTKERKKQISNEKTISATISIANANKETVQRFFWELNRFAVMDEFNLVSRLEKAKIQINKTDSYMIMLKATFSLLFNPPNEKTDILDNTLLDGLIDILRFLYHGNDSKPEIAGTDAESASQTAELSTEADSQEQHIKIEDSTELETDNMSEISTDDAIELGIAEETELSAAEKQEIAQGIFDLFYSPEFLTEHWDSKQPISWIQNKDDLKVFWDWLGDPEATSKLRRAERDWLDSVKKGPNRTRNLLAPLMKIIASEWLTKRDWDAVGVFCTISDTLIMISEDDPQPSDFAQNQDILDYMNDDDPDEIPVALIKKAGECCRELLSMTQYNSICHMRLGDTYRELTLDAEALEEYIQAIKMMLEARASNESFDEDALHDALLSAGKLSEEDELSYYQQAKTLDPKSIDVQYAILKYHILKAEWKDAASILIEIAGLKDDDHPDQLLSVLEMIIEERKNNLDDNNLFNSLISVVSSRPDLQRVLTTCMDLAIAKARSKERFDHLAILQLQKGIAESLCDDENSVSRAMSCWEDCWSLAKLNSDKDGEKVFRTLLTQAGELLSMYHFDKMHLHPEKDVSYHVMKIEEIIRLQALNGTNGLTKAKCYLAAHYTRKGDQSRARDIFKSDVITAFNIFADDDPANDWIAYSSLASILTHCGEKNDALMAYELLPYKYLDRDILCTLLSSEDEMEDEAGTRILAIYKAYCDKGKDDDNEAIIKTLLKDATLIAKEVSSEPISWGRALAVLESMNAIFEKDFHWRCAICGDMYGFGSDLYACQFCFSARFCEDCHGNLCSSKGLEQLTCRGTHEWYRLPSWDLNSLLQAYRKQINSGSDLKVDTANKLTTTVNEWLGALCDKWGLKKETWGFARVEAT